MAANKMSLISAHIGSVEHQKEAFDAWRRTHQTFENKAEEKLAVLEASAALRKAIARTTSAMMDYFQPAAKNVDRLKLSDAIFLKEVTRVVMNGGIKATPEVPGVREVLNPDGTVLIWGSAPIPATPALSAEQYIARLVQTDTARIARIASAKAKNDLGAEEDLPLAHSLELVND